MLRFFKRFKQQNVEIATETLRERFERVSAEMNEVLGDLPVMPKVEIDAEARAIHIEAPEQFADEALALPKPTEEEQGEKGAEGEETPEDQPAKAAVEPESEKTG